MSLKNKDILIIDDDLSIRTFISKILENVGCNVSSASSVAEAMSFLTEKIPNLIILDLMMPGENGFTLLEKRLSDKKLQTIPVLVFSAVSDKNKIHRALSYPNTDYLLKPINTAMLLQKIRKNISEITLPPFVFREDKRPKVSVKISGNITKINEVSCVLNAPVKFNQQEVTINLDSNLFNEMDFEHVQLKSKKTSVFMGTGLYDSVLMFIGVTEQLAKKIRTLKWKK